MKTPRQRPIKTRPDTEDSPEDVAEWAEDNCNRDNWDWARESQARSSARTESAGSPAALARNARSK